MIAMSKAYSASSRWRSFMPFENSKMGLMNSNCSPADKSERTEIILGHEQQKQVSNKTTLKVKTLLFWFLYTSGKFKIEHQYNILNSTCFGKIFFIVTEVFEEGDAVYRWVITSRSL